MVLEDIFPIASVPSNKTALAKHELSGWFWQHFVWSSWVPWESMELVGRHRSVQGTIKWEISPKGTLDSDLLCNKKSDTSCSHLSQKYLLTDDPKPWRVSKLTSSWLSIHDLLQCLLRLSTKVFCRIVVRDTWCWMHQFHNQTPSWQSKDDHALWLPIYIGHGNCVVHHELTDSPWIRSKNSIQALSSAPPHLYVSESLHKSICPVLDGGLDVLLKPVVM